MLIIMALADCARRNPTLDSRNSPGAEGFCIACSTDTIDRVRFEFKMILIVLIMEILLLFNMLAASILFCIECGKNCNVCSRTEIPQDHVFVQRDQNFQRAED